MGQDGRELGEDRRDEGTRATGRRGEPEDPGRGRVALIMEVSRWELWGPWGVLRGGAGDDQKIRTNCEVWLSERVERGPWSKRARRAAMLDRSGMNSKV